MNTTRIKINSKTFVIDEGCEQSIVDYVKTCERMRCKRIEMIFEDVKQKIFQENPNIDKTKLLHELNYILCKCGYKHYEIARYLRIERTTSNKNVDRIENELWLENRLSISEKRITKRIEAMKNYVNSSFSYSAIT